jgi:CRISPR-associated protein Csd1
MRQPADSSDAAQSECLVCGQHATPIRVHPLVKRVPGGTSSGISFVSFNEDAFESLGLEKSENAPICIRCAEAYGTALNRLFHPQYTAPTGEILGRRSFRLSDNTAVIYWAAQSNSFEEGFSLLDDDSADPLRVQALYESIGRGQPATLDDPTTFFALVVTGGQGRATLRGYHQTTVGQAKGNIKQYFDDIEIARRFPTAPRWPALNRLVRSLAAQSKFENVDPDLARRLFLAILSGGLFPPAVLQAAIRRLRSEPENPGRGQYKHTQERLALIRATLNRQLRSSEWYPIKDLVNQEIPPVLDPSCTNNAYCLGRLFAVLEKLQGDAIGNPNATIADRFYGAASATPATVFGTLLRKAQHHLGKMRGPFYAIQIQEILALLNPDSAFPSTLALEEQGLFALGYYHQRADLWKAKETTDSEASQTDDSAAR